MKTRITFFFILFTTLQLIAQSPLTITQIMKGQDFVGHWPSNVSWSEDNQTIYFNWNPNKDAISSLYKTNFSGMVPVKVSAEENLSRTPRSSSYNDERSKMVYEKHDDLFIKDVLKKLETRITKTAAKEQNPYFAKDQNSIIYQMGDNLYKWNFSTNGITQLTYFVDKLDDDAEDKKKTKQEEWLARDQAEYFEVLRIRKGRSDARKSLNESLEDFKPYNISKKGQRLSDVTLSPDERFITYRLTKFTRGKSTKVPDFVTEEGYIKNLSSRAKVGAPQPKENAWIYDTHKDTTYQMNNEDIPGIKDKPDFLKDYHTSIEEYSDQYEEERSVYIHGPYYNTSGTRNIVVIRSQDNKDRWLMNVNLESGKLDLIEQQHDDAWIGGPGIAGWNFSSGNIGWVNDEVLYYQSEKSGFSHLYTHNFVTNKSKKLTSGNFEIISAQLSQDKSTFYITSNKPGPEQHQFYHMPSMGGKMTPITDKLGGHRIAISPDEKQLALLYSYSNRPWELYVMANQPGAQMKQVTHSTTAVFEAYDWRDPEIISFTAQDGAKVKARIYNPQSTKKNGAAVIFVHGAGYLQNVHKWWSSYYREYMFHNFLTDQGYTVLDIDYRASNGYGRDWRTGIYRWMGGKDLSDQVDGAKYLVDAMDIDADRIGIYGGSYGGFITLMGLFTAPKTFKCGAALRSVTDWAHYNHGYTSNILNTPVEDSIAYYKSSPIYHAENLEGHLLMLHGMIDRNVQFQDVVRLSQRLIELGKDNWELAVFPKEGHGFIEASSWADEYKRIYNLFEEYLNE